MLIRKKDLKKFILARIKENRPGWNCTRVSPSFMQLAERKVHQLMTDFINGTLDTNMSPEPCPNILYNTRVRREFTRQILEKYPVITKIFINKSLTPLITQQFIQWLDHMIHSHRSKGKTFDP